MSSSVWCAYACVPAALHSGLRRSEVRAGVLFRRGLQRPPHQDQQNRQDIQRREEDDQEIVTHIAELPAVHLLL